MQAAVASARNTAARRATALRAITGSRTYASKSPVPLVKAEEDPQLNGYPVLPWVSKQSRPAFGWDDWQMRRNFGEPLHEKEELLSMWGPDISFVPPRTALFQFTLATLGFVGFGFLVKYALIPDRPAVAREYPFSGLATELGGEEQKARPEDESDEE